jgi:hypothetical protein
MPREPANPFGLVWSPMSVAVLTADPLPGAGLMWPFGPWDSHWWPVAANDAKSPTATHQEQQRGQDEAG